MKQIEVLNQYYTNLDYDNNKEKALVEIYNLSETVRFHNSVNYAERMETLVNIIQQNISSFKSVCRHVDVIDTIIEYLITCVTDIERIPYDITEEIFDMILMMLLTVFNICKEPAIQSFLLDPIFIDSLWEIEYMESELEYCLSLFDLEHMYTETEMIILEDSDLYAVINYLIMTDNSSLCKIWVQKQVEEKFLWLMKRHNSDFFTIDTFQSLKDIPLRGHKSTINITSIWSEDIVAAKNLALSLNSHIIFINAYMDFSKFFFPYTQIIDQEINQETLKEIYEKKSDSSDIEHDIEQSVNLVHISHITEINSTSIRNLFYDGIWQEPVKGMYWKHNDNLWANATNNDVIRCCESAEKGFKTWSIKSMETRIQILSKFVPILKLKGKLLLVAIIERWLNFPYLFPVIQGSLIVNKDEIIELMEVRMPSGVIILREENENVLFFRLMQILVAGNSVIVMFDANFCNLTEYCDMFSTCGIPSGVINLLSHEDVTVLECKLCSRTYTDYANQIFLKGNSKQTYIEPYKKLTIPKNIIFRLKNFF